MSIQKYLLIQKFVTLFRKNWDMSVLHLIFFAGNLTQALDQRNWESCLFN